MTVSNSYFDIIIKGDSFWMVETASKSNENSAVTTLEKIEFVVKSIINGDVKSSSGNQPYYSKQLLLSFLKDKALEICSGYVEKQSKLTGVAKAFFGQEKQVKEICTRIENYISPPVAMAPLTDDVIYEIHEHLNERDLRAFEQINRHGQSLVADTMMKRVRGLGYVTKDSTDAKAYLQGLFREITRAFMKGILPLPCIVFDRKTLEFDPEKSLQKLEHLTIDDFFKIISNKKIYSFKKIIVLMLKKYKNITKITSNDLLKYSKSAVAFAKKYSEKGIVELLVKNGVNIDDQDKH